MRSRWACEKTVCARHGSRVYRKRSATVSLAHNSVDYHIIPGIGKLPLAALRKSDLEKFYVEQMKSGNLARNGVGDKKLSGAVIRSMHTRIKCALDQALKEGLVNRNKAVGCKLPPKKKRNRGAVTRRNRAAAYTGEGRSFL